MIPRWIYRLNQRPVTLAEGYDGLAYVAVSTSSRPFPAP